MKTLAEIQALTNAIFRSVWTTREGKVVPAITDLGLGNDGVELTATVLYADLADSTGLVNAFKPKFAAEIYKTYLQSTCEIIRNNSGEITAFDGDRVMAIFMGDSPNTTAAKCALQIKYIVKNVVSALMKQQYPESTYDIKHCVGIDTSKLLVARAGVRGDTDLVWVGRAANYAAKLCALRDGDYSTFITEDVHNRLKDSSKLGGSPPQSMWEKVMWDEMGIPVYRSSWWWEIP